jgi:hypothetical protein
MKSTKLLIVLYLFVSCSNPVSKNVKESVITCLNGISLAIRYNAYSQANKPEYFTNDIIPNNWTTLELQFNLHDSLKIISFSPNYNDTLCFDTIWAEDTNHNMKIYTFENIVLRDTANHNYLDTTGELYLGWNHMPEMSTNWTKLDNKSLAICPYAILSDSTYSCEINFTRPIISNGYVKIRIRIRKP